MDLLLSFFLQLSFLLFGYNHCQVNSDEYRKEEEDLTQIALHTFLKKCAYVCVNDYGIYCTTVYMNVQLGLHSLL